MLMSHNNIRASCATQYSVNLMKGDIAYVLSVEKDPFYDVRYHNEQPKKRRWFKRFRRPSKYIEVCWDFYSPNKFGDGLSDLIKEKSFSLISNDASYNIDTVERIFKSIIYKSAPDSEKWSVRSFWIQDGKICFRIAPCFESRHLIDIYFTLKCLKECQIKLNLSVGPFNIWNGDEVSVDIVCNMTELPETISFLVVASGGFEQYNIRIISYDRPYGKKKKKHRSDAIGKMALSERIFLD